MTDRGVPRALLMPLPEVHRVHRGLAEGWITRQRQRAPGPARPVPAPPGPTTDELLAEDRGEQHVQYVDSSALLKRQVREPDTDVAERLRQADAEWVTAAHTEVEVRLARRLAEAPDLLRQGREHVAEDWAIMYVVALDARTCDIAGGLAETTGARTLDALHLAAAQRAGAPALRLVVFDVRLAQTARSLGWPVMGA